MIGGILEKEFAKLDRVKQISLIWLFVAALNDLIITISLAQFLVRSYLVLETRKYANECTFPEKEQDRVLGYRYRYITTDPLYVVVLIMVLVKALINNIFP